MLRVLSVFTKGVALLLLIFLFSCEGRQGANAPVIETGGEEHGEHHEEGHHGHKAHHGGCLNVVGSCEIGHAEVRLDDGRLELWFVGGGNDTGSAVKVAAEKISLKVLLPGNEEKELELAASPLRLAGESIGDCSHFVGEAEWLRDIEEFHAEGGVDFRGGRRELIIEWPEGYDPEHHHN